MSGEPRVIECAELARRLWAYLDRELPPASVAEVEAHLALCAHCFSIAEAQRSFKHLLRHLPEDGAATAPLRARVEQVLEAARRAGP